MLDPKTDVFNGSDAAFLSAILRTDEESAVARGGRSRSDNDSSRARGRTSFFLAEIPLEFQQEKRMSGNHSAGGGVSQILKDECCRD